MARYWLYLNDEVAGPFAVEQLIRQRGFSRQTLVCVDDASGKPSHWISPAEIPELAHIFKAADEQHAAPVPAPAPIKQPLAPGACPSPTTLYAGCHAQGPFTRFLFRLGVDGIGGFTAKRRQLLLVSIRAPR